MLIVSDNGEAGQLIKIPFDKLISIAENAEYKFVIDYLDNEGNACSAVAIDMMPLANIETWSRQTGTLLTFTK
jgi:hypothetical protein